MYVLSMRTIRHETTATAEVTSALAELAAVTDRLLSAVSAATAEDVGMATAGSVCWRRPTG